MSKRSTPLLLLLPAAHTERLWPLVGPGILHARRRRRWRLVGLSAAMLVIGLAATAAWFHRDILIDLATMPFGAT